MDLAYDTPAKDMQREC